MKYRILLLLTLLSSMVYSQTIEEKVQKLENYTQYNPIEKIYTHTDRSSYTAGETVWFKTYNTIGIYNNLSMLSQINYIELIDPKDRVIENQIIGLTLGLGSGSMELADTLIEGTYRLRAYTSWMMNYDSDFFYEKEIVVSNGRVDNILTETTLKTEGNNSFYSVQLKTISGLPLSKTNVKYEVIENGKILDRGNERTDESGLLLIKINEKNRGKEFTLSFTSTDKRVINKLITTKVFNSDNSLQLFPEGGHILSDVLNKIGFKAIMPNGRGIKASIVITNSKNEIASTAETNILGMGSLSFFPTTGETYQASVKFGDGTEKSIVLPEIKTSGMSLIINNNNPSRIYAQMNISEDLISNHEFYFVAHHLSQVYYLSKQKVNKKEVVFSAPKESFPTGILTITILNQNYKPVFERPIFHFNEQDLFVPKITVDKSSYGKRAKISTDIKIETQADSLEIASLSATVINLNNLTDTTSLHSNIWSALLLESDIKGHIENPGYYFPDNNQFRLLDLDLLLGTQGWRKINWEEMEIDLAPKKYPAEKSLSVRGHTRKIGRKSPASNSNVQLISTENFLNFVDTTSSEDGYFVFDDLVFPDSSKFLISAKDEKGKNNIDISIEERDIPSIVNFNGGINDVNAKYLKQLTLSKSFFQELERKGLMSGTIDIEEVVVTRQVKKAPEHSRNLNGPGNADQTILAEDLESCPTLSMCLAGRLLGVVFQNGIPHNTRGMGQMQVIMDGMYVEADMLDNISPMDVASIEVLRNIGYTAIYGSYGGNGVIVVTTKIGTERNLNYTPKGLITIQPKGLSISKEFYKPVYEVGSTATYNNDMRTTIHWEPFITTDINGHAKFDFYTSDQPGIYRIILEGLNLQGQIGRKMVDIVVKD